MTSPCPVHLRGTAGIHRQAQVAPKTILTVDDHGAESAGVGILQQPVFFRAAIKWYGAAHTIVKAFI